MGAITTAFVKQFGSTLETLVQQKGSRLMGAVRMENDLNGEEKYYDQVGEETASLKTTRHADVEYAADDYQRRRVVPVDVYWAKLIDKEDKLKMLIDPTSTLLQSGQWAIGRKIDDLIIAAASGTAYTGKAGGTSTALPTAQKIVYASSGLTLAKLLAAKEILDGADVDPEEERFIALTADQVTDLLNTTEVKNADYNTVKALAAGQINTFLGLRFILCNRLALDGSSHRLILCWAKSGLLLAQASGMFSSIDRLPVKHYATQAYASISCGSTRMQEEKVVEIACEE